MEDRYCELVASNHYGSAQPEVVAQWFIDNGATCESSLVTPERLAALAAGQLEGEEWSSVVEDLYTFPVIWGGARYRLVFDEDQACYIEELEND